MAHPADARIPNWAATVPEDEGPRPGKRSRVALACQRCKLRKQKCNGTNPCSKCRSLDIPCEYVIPQKPMPFGKNQYIKSLERRVAELETILAKQGMPDLSQDHWLRAEQVAQFADEPVGSSQCTPDTENDDNELDWQDGVDDVVSVLRSLSMDANGTGYFGGSSHVTMGKLFGFLGGGHHGRTGSQSRKGSGVMGPLDQADSEVDVEPIDFLEVPPDVANRLLAGFLKHIATRFPVVHSVWIRKLHSARLSLDDVQEQTILHLVYAGAGRFLETAGETGVFFPKRHYASALRNFSTILDYDNIRSVSALMLMAIYCLRNPVGPGAWTYSRMAMLVALNLGLHRKTNSMKKHSVDNELRKRVFWSTYAFDRQISIPLGRPFAISDRDIDVPLPLDIDEATTEDGFPQVYVPHDNSAPENSTSLSSFLQIVRIRRIESDIQQTIYRVDQTPEISDSTVDEFLQRLEIWKTLIPLDARTKRDTEAVPFDGYDVYLVYFFKCKRLLLYPQISKMPVNPRFLKECAMACAGVCGAYKRLHQAMAVGYSIMALQTVFMAGLTLVYCIWISPDEIFDITTSNGIHDCTIVLFVIAERVRAAKKYRNAFEVIRQRVIDQISDGSSRQPRQTMSGLAAELQSSMHSWEVNQPFEVDNDSFEQFSQIIQEMSGNHSESVDSSSGVAGVCATGLGFEFPATETSASFDSNAELSADMISSTQIFGSELVGFEQEHIYNDGLSPWFSAATGDLK